MGKIDAREMGVIRDKFAALSLANEEAIRTQVDLEQAEKDLREFQDRLVATQARLDIAEASREAAEADYLTAVEAAVSGELSETAPQSADSVVTPAEAATDAPSDPATVEITIPAETPVVESVATDVPPPDAASSPVGSTAELDDAA